MKAGAALRNWPLPSPDGDKEQRGHLLIIGRWREIPSGLPILLTPLVPG